LMAAFVLANAVSAMAQGFAQLTVARFAAGVPHGAYFGLATLAAASMVPVERRGRAISGVMLGLPVATVAGVPAATWLGQHLGWRTAYGAVAVIGC
jgi:MFS transporter, DHA1 family, inner membrane transport protein